MRAIVYSGEGRARLRDDVTLRAPAPDEVVVRLAAAGVCHSDLSVLDGTIVWRAPSVLGHEGAGVVESVGDAVTTVAPGDHVVISTIANCGKCRYCSVGRPTHCRQSLGLVSTPFEVDGGPASNFAATSTFADATVVKEVQAVRIPDDVPLTSACLVACGAMTGAGAVLNRADVRQGDTAVVFGLGGVGLSAVQALRLKEASRILAVDTEPRKAALALELGATDFIDASQVDALPEIKRLLPGSGAFGDGGVDWSFDCVGHPAVLRTALDALDWGGTCVAVGQPPVGVTVDVPITHLLQVDRGLIGTRAGGVRPHHDIPMLLGLYRQGLFKLDEMVSRTYPLEGFDDLVADMRSGGIARGVLTFDR